MKSIKTKVILFIVNLQHFFPESIFVPFHFSGFECFPTFFFCLKKWIVSVGHLQKCGLCHMSFESQCRQQSVSKLGSDIVFSNSQARKESFHLEVYAVRYLGAPGLPAPSSALAPLQAHSVGGCRLALGICPVTTPPGLLMQEVCGPGFEMCCSDHCRDVQCHSEKSVKGLL